MTDIITIPPSVALHKTRLAIARAHCNGLQALAYANETTLRRLEAKQMRDNAKLEAKRQAFSLIAQAHNRAIHELNQLRNQI